MEREKLTGEELRMIVLMRCMWGMIDGRGKRALEKRLRMTEHGWKMYRQAFGLLTKMFNELRETIPQRQLCQIDMTLEHGEVGVRLQRASQYDDDMTVVRAQPIETVVGCVLAAECAICVRERADVKRCLLRKAIDEICPPNSYETTGCVYRDLALEKALPGEI